LIVFVINGNLDRGYDSTAIAELESYHGIANTDRINRG
jgi:hypothetical protein